jgi:hypothetical protein
MILTLCEILFNNIKIFISDKGGHTSTGSTGSPTAVTARATPTFFMMLHWMLKFIIFL